jgi:butyrate kinase
MSAKKVERAELVVLDKHGVLDQITGHIRQQGWNIKRLDIGEHENGTVKMIIDIEVAGVNFAKSMEKMSSFNSVVNVTLIQDGGKTVFQRPGEDPKSAANKEPEPRVPPKKAGVFRIMAINPGSTSTKFGIYDDETCLFTKTVRHDAEALAQYGKIIDQKELRAESIMQYLKTTGVELSSLDAVVGRGGLIKPIDSGVYAINEAMLADCRTEAAMVHATCLGAIIASEIATPLGLPAYIVDPIVVYEMEPVTKLTGIPGIERINAFHALNQKAVAKRIAAELGKPYESFRFVIAHMGGGCTIGAHRYGRVIDVSDGLSGEGPFTPERSGAIPPMPIIDMCFSGEYTKEEMKALLVGKGGVMAYLGTNDITEVLKMINAGDDYAALVLDSMLYQTAKEIGAMVVALEGRVDAIILTGGLAYSAKITGAIKQRVDRLAPVIVYPGEDEIWALAGGALRVLRGTETVRKYI